MTKLSLQEGQGSWTESRVLHPGFGFMISAALGERELTRNFWVWSRPLPQCELEQGPWKFSGYRMT